MTEIRFKVEYLINHSWGEDMFIDYVNCKNKTLFIKIGSPFVIDPLTKTKFKMINHE